MDVKHHVYFLTSSTIAKKEPSPHWQNPWVPPDSGGRTWGCLPCPPPSWPCHTICTAPQNLHIKNAAVTTHASNLSWPRQTNMQTSTLPRQGQLVAVVRYVLLAALSVCIFIQYIIYTCKRFDFHEILTPAGCSSHFQWYKFSSF